LSARQLHHQILIYADDAVIFLRPDLGDINLVLDLLRLFGTASGLKTNVQKSSVVPIRCDDQILNVVKELLPCDFVGFPCKYLGLPLSLTRLTKGQMQNIIDRMSSLLLGWKSELMNRAGRAVHIQFVMATRITYMAMVLEFPSWAYKAMAKLQRGFLWRGSKETKGRHYLLAWPKVTRPKELRGLGIHDM
jgi:hypothetical protein